MPRITLVKSQQVIEGDSSKSLMANLIDHQVPVASSCSGDGVCAKCKIKIISGQENLSPENETEKFLKIKNNISADHRISCQTLVLGDITIDASYW